MRIVFATMLGLVSSSAWAQPFEVPEGHEIEITALIAKVGAAYGGEDALRALSGFRLRGKIMSVADGLNGKLRLLLSLDGSMRAEISYPTRNEVRILSGDLAWNGGRETQRPSKPAMARSMRLQFHRLAAPFEIVGSSSGDFRLAGTTEEGWVSLRRQWSQDVSMTYEIDALTGLIRRVRGVMSDEGVELEFVTESWDFREIDGVLFPFRMTTLVGDQVAAETILDRVTVVDAFARESFLPSAASDI